jgi:hypothetical protein
MICSEIDAHPEAVVTVDNTPRNIVLFELTEHATSAGRLLILARRPSDGASKAWDISTLQRRDNNAPVNLANVGGNAPFGAAADLTALAGCTISFFTDGVNVGVTVTGPAATTIEWCMAYSGMQMID